MSALQKPELPGALVPWPDFKTLFRTCFGFDCCAMSDLERHLEMQQKLGTWHRLSDWEQLEDSEILQCLNDLQPIRGEIHVVSDACYRKGFSPFRCRGETWAEMAEAHRSWSDQHLVDGDLLIINVSRRRIWAFHHEGVYTVLTFRADGSLITAGNS